MDVAAHPASTQTGGNRQDAYEYYTLLRRIRSTCASASTAEEFESMSSKLQRASVIAVTATFFAALASAQGSGAVAQDRVPAANKLESSTQFIS